MANFCAVFGCGKRGDRDKGTSFYRLPAIITHQGEQTKELSKKRKCEWQAAIKRQDTNYAARIMHTLEYALNILSVDSQANYMRLLTQTGFHQGTLATENSKK